MTAYPVAGKQKSFDLCLAFIKGCGGQIAGAKLREGAAVFYGVDHSNELIWRNVLARGGDWYYIDNSYFDAARQQRFRITRNRLQHSGIGTSTGERFRALGIQIQPWRAAGRHIVVCPQSLSFMHNLAGRVGDWGRQTVADLRITTDREIRLRPWSRDKGGASGSLAEDLVDAHALVTWSSAAAVTSVLAGVPVIVHAADCAARLMSGSDIEALPLPEREIWAGVLSDNEWTVEEMVNGTAWRALNETS